MNTFHLTEEIARWAFEVACNQQQCWHIAFTNPTAGPWKMITAPDPVTGEIGEVFRFEREETRPDILIVNDHLKLVVIIEAKDSIGKLLDPAQVEKSVSVVNFLTRQLADKGSCKYWGKRAEYDILVGLLWGKDRVIPKQTYQSLFVDYTTKLTSRAAGIRPELIGIETERIEDDLQCRICSRDLSGVCPPIAFDVARSLSLPLFHP